MEQERRGRPSGDWLCYFRDNARAPDEVPWQTGAELTGAERACVASSLQGFQRGESSSGARLVRYARAYGRERGDPDYVAAIRSFVAEEQRHARDLGRFLELNGIPLARANLLDRVFRALRHLFGTLEVALSVLLTAEIIAKVYYAALRAATGSAILRALCERILSDEEMHVRFHSEHLGKLQAERSLPVVTLAGHLRRLFLRAVCRAVWTFHRSVLERGGLSRDEFRAACREELADSLRITREVREAMRLSAAADRAATAASQLTGDT
jgi:hypothetical protein